MEGGSLMAQFHQVRIPPRMAARPPTLLRVRDLPSQGF